MKVLITVQNKNEVFDWGPVLLIHTLAEYDIIEYHPEIMKNNFGTNEYEKEIVMFHSYVDGEDTNHTYHTLEQAIIGAIAYKYDGLNSQAAHYISRMLKLD